KANLDLEAIEAYDSEADTKYVAALHALKDLKYPMMDQLESLKDALIDVIMASLHMESDIGEDTPQWIRELRPNSSQLKILREPLKWRNADLGKELENLRTLFFDLQRCVEMDVHLDALRIEFDEELYPHMLIVIVGHRWVIGYGLSLAVIKCGESTKLRHVFVDVVSVGIAKEADTKYVAALHALKDLKSDGVPVLVPTVAPQGLAILLADAATQTKTSNDGASTAMYNLD
nr:hypothetical protein [Tanacetum cinerariifolium]